MYNYYKKSLPEPRWTRRGQENGSMAMLNVLEMDRLYQNEWVVLDRALKVVDHGPDLSLLRARHGENASRYTMYFVASSRDASSCESPIPAVASAR